MEVFGYSVTDDLPDNLFYAAMCRALNLDPGNTEARPFAGVLGIPENEQITQMHKRLAERQFAKFLAQPFVNAERLKLTMQGLKSFERQFKLQRILNGGLSIRNIIVWCTVGITAMVWRLNPLLTLGIALAVDGALTVVLSLTMRRLTNYNGLFYSTTYWIYYGAMAKVCKIGQSLIEALPDDGKFQATYGETPV